MAQARRIQGFGYQVLTAYNGDGALRQALEIPDISLVLTDIDLGSGPDGPETARRILARKTLPILFLTSHTEREYVERVRKITRYGYVLKDAGDFVLESAIEMAFTLFEAHETLRQSQEALSTIVDNVDEGIYLMLDGRYTYANEGFYLLTGYQRDELLSSGFDYHTLLDADSVAQVEARRLARLRGEKLSERFRIHLVRKDGSKLEVEVSTTSIGDPLSRTIAGIMRPVRSS